MFEFEKHKTYFHVKASGKLTHEDYVDHLIPKLEEFIQQHDKLNVFFEVTDLKGWEWQAAWDDFKTGMKHRKDFNKIAITSDQAWMGSVVKFFSIFIHGEVRFFDYEDKDKAKSWIAEV